MLMSTRLLVCDSIPTLMHDTIYFFCPSTLCMKFAKYFLSFLFFVFFSLVVILNSTRAGNAHLHEHKHPVICNCEIFKCSWFDLSLGLHCT